MPTTQTPISGPYNAAVDLLGRNLAIHPEKIAFVDPEGAYSYAEVADRADRAGGAFASLGLTPGDRIALVMLDGIDFVSSFLGAMKRGFVPIALNTLFKADDFDYILSDSAAKAAIVSEALLPQVLEAIRLGGWQGQLVVSGAAEGLPSLHALMANAGPAKAHRTLAEDTGFWLYSSGSTGRPKGCPHRHSSPALAARLFARDTLGLERDDVVFSAAKLFFAYGLGNSLFFPMAAGATTILYPDRVTPEVVTRLLTEHRVTVFCGVPTLYRALLDTAPPAELTLASLRLCLSAGEALPEELGRAWRARTGVEVVDGIGSTEMLHIYIANRPGAVRYGVTGWPVSGYEVKLLDEQGDDAGPGALGELYVRGPTMVEAYWNQPEKSAATFVDGWMRTGDKFLTDTDGCLIHCGRADDMLKVSGIWVSPTEVEGALLAHEAVSEAAVIGVTDSAGLVKTKAFVVAKPGVVADETLGQALKDFTKARLAPYKYPRSIEFVDQLPRTATGKIRRHVLRDLGLATPRTAPEAQR